MEEYGEKLRFRFCPLCGGEVETGRIDLNMVERQWLSAVVFGESVGLFKTAWYPDENGESRGLEKTFCFAEMGSRRTAAAFCKQCFKIFAVFEPQRPDGAIL